MVRNYKVSKGREVPQPGLRYPSGKLSRGNNANLSGASITEIKKEL